MFTTNLSNRVKFDIPNTHQVYIDINREFKADDESHQVHAQLLRKLTNRIVNNFRDNKESFTQNYPHTNLNYLITGKRGSGKSTFLKNLLTRIINTSDDRCRFESLLEYDPSASTGKNNYFILNVFAALRSKLKQMSSCSCSRDVYPCIEPCNALVRELSKGLARLSEGRPPLSQLTPDIVFNLSLDNPERDEYIRELVGKLIDKMCEMCNLTAFVITIDDSDTKSHQCFQVLEDLRLYLTHPRVIVLMAADKTMLLERIREHHFKEFSYEYHHSETERNQLRMEAVISHASQYLLKLFPLYNQYELQNFLTLSRKTEPVIVFIRYPENINTAEPCELREIITIVFQHTITSSKIDVQTFVDLFFDLPMRAILQIIKYWTDDHIWDAIKIVQDAKDKDKEWKAAKMRIAYSTRMAVKRVLQAELGTAKYNFESLLANDGRIFYTLLLHLCRDIGNLEHGFYLTSNDGMQREEKYVSLLLAVTLRKIIKDFEGFLSYILYGPATVSLYAKSLNQYQKGLISHKLDESIMKRCFDDYMQVGCTPSATRWARHANMIWCNNGETTSVHTGILRLNTTDEVSTLNQVIADWLKTGIDIKTNFKKAFSYIICLTRSDEHDNSYFVSIFNYLAFVLKCFSVFKSEKGNKQAQERETLRIILKSIKVKSCRYPEWISTENATNPEHTTNNTHYFNIRDKIKSIDRKVMFKMANELAKEICDWCKGTADDEKCDDDITPSEMGTVWSDFYYSLRHISRSNNLYPAAKERSAKETDSAKLIDPILRFKNVVHYFQDFFCCEVIKQEMSDFPNDLTYFYRNQIGSFPLTNSLILAVDEFTDYYKNHKDDTRQITS